MMTEIDERRTEPVAAAETDTSGPGAAPSDDAGDASDRRNLGALAHLSAFVGLAGVPSFLGPLVVWLLHRERDPWVADQARDALNFNLSLLIYAAAAVVLSIVTLGVGLLVTIPAAVVGAIAWLVVPVVAALRAADGNRYRYPLTLELVR